MRHNFLRLYEKSYSVILHDQVELRIRVKMAESGFSSSFSDLLDVKWKKNTCISEGFYFARLKVIRKVISEIVTENKTQLQIINIDKVGSLVTKYNY